MNCRFYSDYSRECLPEIGFLPRYTLPFCESKNHTACPYFLFLTQKRTDSCTHLKNCHFFRTFALDDFERYAEVVSRVCCTNRHKSCRRYIRHKQGHDVPADLHPISDPWRLCSSHSNSEHRDKVIDHCTSVFFAARQRLCLSPESKNFWTRWTSPRYLPCHRNPFVGFIDTSRIESQIRASSIWLLSPTIASRSCSAADPKKWDTKASR